MNRVKMIVHILILIAFVVGFSFSTSAQYGSKHKVTRSSTAKEAVTKPSGTLTARLLDPDKEAKEKAATVEVKVTGIKLVDPHAVNEQPRAGQGHIHYQVDDGPVIATTSTMLSFHELSSGKHQIVIQLAGSDHKPLGQQQTLNVTIP